MEAKFCPRCGRGGELYKGFCLRCFGELSRLVDFPAFIELRKCRRCDKMLLNGDWLDDTPENFSALVGSQLVVRLHDHSANIDRGRDSVFVSVRGYADQQKLIEVRDSARLHLKVGESLCNACFRTSAQKYEVKIQLRKKQEHDEQLFKKLEDSIIILAGAASETDNKAASFWREDTRDGPDFLFGYKEVGEKIAKSLSKRFRVRMQESMQQNGFEKSGKPRIRITFCARI